MSKDSQKHPCDFDLNNDRDYAGSSEECSVWRKTIFSYIRDIYYKFTKYTHYRSTVTGLMWNYEESLCNVKWKSMKAVRGYSLVKGFG